MRIHTFLVLRFLQGLGVCAGLVLSRAVINDLLDKKEAGELYLIVFPFIGMSPALAPSVGGVLLQAFNWQAIFIFLSLFILLTILLCFLCYEETVPVQRRQRFSPFGVVKGCLGVFKNKQFVFYALIPCFSYLVYFAYIYRISFFTYNFWIIAIHIGYSYITYWL